MRCNITTINPGYGKAKRGEPSRCINEAEYRWGRKKSLHTCRKHTPKAERNPMNTLPTRYEVKGATVKSHVL